MLFEILINCSEIIVQNIVERTLFQFQDLKIVKNEGAINVGNGKDKNKNIKIMSKCYKIINFYS